MSKILRAKGFAAADAVMPENVMVLGTAPDGIYLVLQDKGKVKKGDVIISTEGKHYYSLKTDGGGLRGKGKGNSYGGNPYQSLLVQRVSATLTIDTYKAPRVVKKKVVRKKATKKVAKKITRRRRRA
ncbi:hypothetical protein LCGC14_2160370 [marine sediment metagenome]|uniref:Uncharacterized protein n=1 Tax=marine sediment metagenome TaxID=412755 RepID=A0A0F9G5S4_9ZZZZ